jgi:hypothetical protein
MSILIDWSRVTISCRGRESGHVCCDPGLAEVLPGEHLPDRDVWLLIRRDLCKVPRVRAVADYLIEIFRRDRRLWEGNGTKVIALARR